MPVLDHTTRTEPEGVINGAWMPTVVMDKATRVTRDKFQQAFAEENVDRVIELINSKDSLMQQE